MSKVAIKGNTSGTGTFTVEAPNSNTDRTLVLPDEAGTVVTTGSYVAGITEVDLWRLTSDTSSGVVGPLDFTTNLARATGDGAGYLGTGMTQASGVFTFPSTGLWKIDAYAQFQQTSVGGTSNEYSYFIIRTTTNGSTYDDAAVGQQGSYDANDWGTCACTFLFNVTDTSTHKVMFRGGSQDGVTFKGDTAVHRTYFVFTRMGAAS